MSPFFCLGKKGRILFRERHTTKKKISPPSSERERERKRETKKKPKKTKKTI